jgi:molybdopterin-guanine dinucleotide biosynthesis protein A
MGHDKASLVVRGESLAVRAARVLREVCDPVVEVGESVSGLRAVRETPAGEGPLAALVRGADELGADTVVLLACDLPFVEAPLLRLLAEWPGAASAVPVVDGRPQYACARYGPAAIATARVSLAQGRRSLRDAAAVECDEVSESVWRVVAPEHALADVDTPDDLVRYGLA